jgi:hypothetical protein
MKKIPHIINLFLSLIIHVFCCGLPLVAFVLTSATFSTALEHPIFEWVHQYHLHILLLSTAAVFFAVFQQIKTTKMTDKKLKLHQIKGFKLTCLSVMLLIGNFILFYFEYHNHIAHF